ncbi:hypothetical protein M3P05_19890 [Sansalvadorimonas sp. 2012CJ34-2]|uniref:Uncharacterized protein n=1 Tax=Parendozoicomonas callyspongiae TaxID=2942213 RepID=A0ABT0PMG4_9GAMM|nr:hypothetical protein [Sansalvadorimonas sp. 2012CJ34-2]MCL6272186.1 hypothetical protein [Sansalvadorimonas sp. 2012CJ34-2]
MVIDSTPIDKELFLQKQNSLRVAIFIKPSQEEKYYHIDGGDAYIYPGLAEKLKLRMEYITKQVDIIYADNPYGQHLTYDIVIFPDWEIEERNLHVNLIFSFNKYGKSFSVSEKNTIDEREDWKAPVYFASSATIIGLPIAMAIDNNDIAGKIEMALDKIILKLENNYLPKIVATTRKNLNSI